MAGGCCSPIRDLDNIVQTSLPNFVCSFVVFVISLLFELGCTLFIHSICVQPIHYCAYELIFICCFIAYNMTFRVAFIAITVRLKIYLPRLLASQLHVWSLIYECLLLDNLHIIIIIIYKQQK
jgi:hypothetical protein